MEIMNSEEEKKKEEYKNILRAHGIPEEIGRIELTIPNLAGNNFCSKCEIVTIHFEGEGQEPLELFSKRAVNNSEYALIMKEMQMFQRESIFFNSILPLLSQFCENKLGKSGLFVEKNFPKCYFADENLVVMENLVKNGYFMLDKKEWHNFDYAKEVMKLFANLHSVSYVLIEEMSQQNFLEKYPNLAVANIWSDLGETFCGPQVKGAMLSCQNTLKNYPVEGADEVLAYLDSLEPNGYVTLSQVFNLDNESCAIVLNHGDAWSCNLLFSWDNPEEKKKLKKAIFIDLQTIHLGSPALDLQNYMHLSVDAEVRRGHWKDLLGIYYDHFKGNVERLKGHVKFTLNDLKRNYRNKSDPGFIFELYLVFGWETLDAFGDPEKVSGDVGGHMTSVMEEATKRAAGGDGSHFSRKIVKAYREFQKLKSECD